MTSKAELLQRQESNEQLRLDCLAGFGVVLDHPICVEAIRIASDMLIATGEDLTGYDLDLHNQLGRSLGSVAANFAEGHGRCMLQDKIRFLRMARGSAYESVVHARILYVDYAQDLKDIIKLAEALDAYILSVIP